MKRQIITLFILTGVFCACHADADNWTEIKKTKNLYPEQTISSHDFKVLDYRVRIWTNDAYKNYEFKKYCPQKVEFKFETSIPRVRGLLSEDTFKIANMLYADLKKQGVCHFIGQTLSPEQLNIYFYLEESHLPTGAQDRIKIPNLLTIQSDPEWKFYSTLARNTNTP